MTSDEREPGSEEPEPHIGEWAPERRPFEETDVWIETVYVDPGDASTSKTSMPSVGHSSPAPTVPNAPPVIIRSQVRPASSATVSSSSSSAPGVPDTADATPSRPRHRRRVALVVTIGIIVLGTGTGLGIWLGTSKRTAGPVVTVSTVVQSVKTGNIEDTVATTGSIAPTDETDLNFAVSGKVAAVDVSTGQTVTAGQALASIADTSLDASLQSAQASLAAAEAQLASDQAAGDSTSQIESDEASVTSAQSQLASAQTSLTEATLTSTISGTVVSVSLTVGEQVGGGGNDGTADDSSDDDSSSAQVVIVSTGSYIVNATVNDTEISEISDGEKAEITPSGSTTQVPGTVDSVGLIATSGSGVATFPIVVTVTGSPGGLYPGASADVTIVVKNLTNVIEVPSSAISYNGGKAQVTVVNGASHVPTSITTGQTSGGETQVTSGLSVGQKILVREVSLSGGPAKTSGNGSTKAPNGQIHFSPGGGSGGFPPGVSGTGGKTGGPSFFTRTASNKVGTSGGTGG